MSNDKPVAIAIIKFFPNKHVTVELNTIKNITPRTLSIAGHLLQKKYSEKKGLFIAEEHRKARKLAQDKADQEKVDDVEFHKKEDERLAKAALEDLPQGKTTEEPKKVEEVKVEATGNNPIGAGAVTNADPAITEAEKVSGDADAKPIDETKTV